MPTPKHPVSIPARARALLGLASILCLFACGGQAQQPANALPAFDAASIRPFVVPATGWAWGPPNVDPVHLRFRGSPLRDIILKAYGLDDFQLTGLPDWADHEFFTIDAVADKPTPPDQMLLMLQRLLADRFQLQIEESEKQQAVWAIVVPPGGSKMKPRTDDEDCPRGISGDDMKAAGAPRNSMSSFNGCTIADLVKAFNRRGNAEQLGRPVIDKTGLTGRYHMVVWQEIDVDDTYTGPGQRMSHVEPFREAVEKELGLKLAGDKQNLHFIKVLTVSRPSPN